VLLRKKLLRSKYSLSNLLKDVHAMRPNPLLTSSRLTLHRNVAGAVAVLVLMAACGSKDAAAPPSA